MNNGLKENEVLRQCLVYLQCRKIFCWRNNTGAYKVGRAFIRYGYVGSSDIIGICKDGRFLAIECKRQKGGVLSEEQKKFLSTIKESGGVAICVNSIDELIVKLKENRVI